MGFLPRLRSRGAETPPTPDHCHVEIDGERVRVALNWNPRASRYTLRLRGSVREPVVTIPYRGTLAEVRGFLDRHRGWLKARIDALPMATPLADGASIPLRGESVRLRHVGGRGTVRLQHTLTGDELVVAGDAEHLPRRVTDFLKREARADLEAATARHAAALGVTVKAIRLGDPASRWGSCSSSGTIAYSWRIIMAPPEVLDYLVAHEVAHLREMNHSPRFWRLVRTICPGMEAGKDWLHRHGASLHAVGAD
ncbi:metal-dependent hydrolase [Kaistia algarum]|nr:metal-dependent hydrolase [Kaistia algarum]